MSLAKLSGGDGFTYYMRNIASHDADERGMQHLADYYSERGESPGRWMGSGLGSLGIAQGERVLEPQMRALFGRGMHPNSEAIIAKLTAEKMSEGWSRRVARNYGVRMAHLGRPFNQYAPDEAGYRYECAAAYAEYNTARGLVDYAPIPDEVREQIQTEVATRMFTEQAGRAPLDELELSSWTARASRPAHKAVSGYDFTFSPVKSVSALWAVAPREIAEKIEAAHHAAIADVLAYLERHAVFTRVGRGSVRQVETEGLIVTAFDHRDSRAGEPMLHTHVVVSNKVRRLHDGEWGALDGRMIYAHNVPASEIYNTRLEHHLQMALGVVFAERPGLDPRKRPIREIASVPAELLRAWSSRTEDITAEMAEMAAEFQDRNAREPTPKDLLRMGEKATLSTRGGKHHARSRNEQRTEWREQAAGLLGGEGPLDAMVSTALHPIAPDPVVPEPVEQVAARTVAVVASGRATWQARHIRAEAERQIRGRIAPHQWRETITAVMDAAMSPPLSIPRGDHDITAPTPALARSDGTSVYTTAGSTLYTSPDIVAAERRLVEIACTSGARTIPAAAVRAADMKIAATAGGVGLNPGQRQMVESFATSGQRLQVALAPAGTGKTTAMRVLTTAWANEGGAVTRTVVGLAPTSTAAAQLHRDTGIPTGTIDMLVSVADRLAAGELDHADAPDWVRAIGPGSLVIIDEAAKTGTLTLDAAVSWLAEQGAVIRAIGDDRQLAAVAAGGVIRDIVDAAGAQTLTRVMRFTDPGEAAASLALREGDPAAIAHYLDHGRVQIGTLDTVTGKAFTAWSADVAAGRDSILLAPTRDLVAELNARARAARLARTPAAGPEVVLGDGLSASAGDVITTRRNNYRLWISQTDHVRNGYRWQVRTVHPDGQVTAAHIGSGRLVTLPADYVAEHTQLGYASTIDAAQGLTVDTCHGVLTGRESRAQLYVMMTRARTGNHCYLGTATTDQDTSPGDYTVAQPSTALDVLTAILGREGTQVSATTAARQAADPHRQLAPAVNAYIDALGAIAEHRLGRERLTEITTGAEQLVPGLSAQDAWPVLRSHLAILEISGHDPLDRLREAVSMRELDTAGDTAAVLDWRLDPVPGTRFTGPMSWLPYQTIVLFGDDADAHHIHTRLRQIDDMIDQISAEARDWLPDTAPRWAVPLLDEDPELVRDLAVWRAAVAVPALDPRLTGPRRYPVAERRAQQHLDDRVTEALGDLRGPAARWSGLAGDLDSRILTDPYWPVLAEHLDRAHAAGIDIETRARQAASIRELPHEQPAAALRWRLADSIDHHEPSPTEQQHESLQERQFAATVRQIQADQWRRMHDEDLAARARATRADLAAATGWNAKPFNGQPRRHESRADKVQARHDRLDAAVEAIDAIAPARRAAIRAENEATTAYNRWQAEQAAPAPVSRWWPWGNEADRIREAHDQLIADLRQEWVDLDNASRRARSAAADAELYARREAGPLDTWDSVRARAADTETRNAELAAAQEEDRELTAREDRITERHTQRQNALRDRLDAIGTEQQRRADLDPEQRDLENRAREHLDGPGAAERREQQQQALQARQRAERDREQDYSIQQHIDPGPSQDYGIGL